MKEYLYDDSDFTYLYSDDVSFGPVSKEPQVAGNATLIKPPENVPNGKIPVFNKKEQRWDIVDDNFWRPFVQVYSYGDPNVAPGKIILPELSQINTVLMKTPEIPKILNPALACFLQPKSVTKCNAKV